MIIHEYAIFYKDWLGISPDRTGPPELVRSSHRHQSGLRSLVLPPRLDRSDYSEPWLVLSKAVDRRSGVAVEMVGIGMGIARGMAIMSGYRGMAGISSGLT